MAKAERFSVKPYTTASGEERWKVQGRKPSGVRIRERFKTLEEALGRRAELEVESLNQTVAFRTRSTRLTDAQLAEAEAAFQKLGSKPLLFAVDYFLTEYREPVMAITVDNAAAKFFADKNGENLRPSSLKDHHSRIGFLQALHGGKLVHTLTTDDVRPAIFRDPNQSPHTTNGNRRVLSAFFRWCLDRHYCMHNPVVFQKAKVDEHDPVILQIDAVQRLLWEAMNFKDGKMIPYFVYELFAALRPAEAARLEPEEVNRQRRGIRLSGKGTKPRARRTVGMKQNLLDWLREYGKLPVIPANWRKDFDEVRRRAGFHVGTCKERDPDRLWVPDILRHTALSNYYAWCRSENRTAAWAGNSPAVLHKHYRDDVSTSAARKYWAITPKSIRAEFQRAGKRRDVQSEIVGSVQVDANKTANRQSRPGSAIGLSSTAGRPRLAEAPVA